MKIIPHWEIPEEERKAVEEILKRIFLSTPKTTFKKIDLTRVAGLIENQPFCWDDNRWVVIGTPERQDLIKKLPSGLYAVEGIEMACIYQEKERRFLGKLFCEDINLDYFKNLFERPKTIEQRTNVHINSPKYASVFERKYSPVAEVIPIYKED
jgi:hypothetical protein